MAVEVGKLIVELEARVEKLERGMKRGRQSVSGFQRVAVRAFNRVGSKLLRMLKRFTGIGTVIGGATAAFGFAQFIRGSIQAAAEVETFRIRLRSLIGDAREADQTLARLTDTAQKVAPSLQQIIEAAATLGTVALGSSAKVESLVDTALNIQAVTGLTMTQTAQNLQRALSAGIGAADLFRERGIRALLEGLTEFSDLVQAPISDVAKAFEQVFGAQGVFGQAAEQFAQTLPGAISRTGDAFFKLKTAVGQALSPVVIAFLTETVIPAFDDLTKYVTEGQDAFATWAQSGVVLLTRGFLFVANALAELVKIVVNLRVQFPDMISRVLIGLSNLINKIRQNQGLFAKIFGIDEATLKPIQDGLAEAGIAMFKFARSGEESTKAVVKQIEQIQDKISEYGNNLKDLGAISRKNAAESQRQANATLADLKGLLEAARLVDDPRVVRQMEAARTRLNKLLQQGAVEAAKAREPMLAEIQAIDLQTEKITKQQSILRERIQRLNEAVDAQQQLAQREGLTDRQRASAERRLQFLIKLRNDEARVLRQELLPAEREKARLAWRQSVLQRQLNAEYRRADRLSTQLEDAMKAIPPLRVAEGREIIRNLYLQLQEEQSIKRRNDLMREGIKDLKDLAALQRGLEELGDTIGFVLATQIQDSLLTMIRGGAVDFGELLADTAAKLLEQSLTDVLKDLGSRLNNLFDKIGGSKLGSALSSAFGFGAMLLSGLFKDTKIETSAAQVESAVTSTQAVRGVIAGPTQIAVAQVGRSVQEAFVETNLILRRQLTVLADILAAVSSGATITFPSPAGFSEDSDEILATTSAALA